MECVFAAFVVALVFTLPARAAGFDDFNLGINAFNRADWAVAIDAFGRALASKDLSDTLKPVAHLDRGISFFRQKRFDDAIADLNANLALQPGNDDGLYWRMLAYAWSGQSAFASADCDTLINQRPRIASLYSQCGAVRWTGGDYAKAVHYFQAAVEIARKPRAWDVLWLEVTRLRAGTPDETQFAKLVKQLDLDGWPLPIINLYLGKGSPESVLAAAEETARAPLFSFFHVGPEQTSSEPSVALKNRRCTTQFFVGEWQVIHDNPGAARDLFQRAKSNCNDSLTVEAELERLNRR